jgi:hypothetical protein
VKVRTGEVLAENILKDWNSNDKTKANAAAFNLGLLVSSGLLSKERAEHLLRYRHDKWDGLSWSALSASFRTGQEETISAVEAIKLFSVVANDNDAWRNGFDYPYLDPFEFENCPGLLADCAQWIFETSRSPIKEFSLASALALLSALFGKKYVGPTGSGLNLYLIMVAPTGLGKGRPLNAPEGIVASIGGTALHVIGPNNVTGDSAIERALRRSSSIVMPWDEFGLVLQDATAKGATSWNVTIRRALLELYSKSEPGMSWRAKLHASSAGDKDELPILRPVLTVLGATTPESFYAGLTASSGPLGILNRLVVIAVNDRPKKQKVEAIPCVPPHLSAALKEALGSLPSRGNLGNLNLQGLASDVFAVPFKDAAAEHRFLRLESQQEDLIARDDELNDVFGRAAENTIRVATISAIGRNPQDPKVSVEDIEWAWAFVFKSAETVLYGARRYIAGSAAEAFRKKVLGHVQDAGSDGIYESRLMRCKGMSGSGREFSDAVKYLIDSSQIKRDGKKLSALAIEKAA